MFEFRPAKRENVGLLIGLAGSSGSGKTYTAMRLAKGLAGGKTFAVIDTEAGRAKHYADQFAFDHGDLKPPFTPGAYADAIMAADGAGYPVIVIDSFSHEHAGEGGILDMQEAEFQRMGGRDSVKLASWVKPKGEHRRMVSRLLQVRAHLILCFRAEEKIEMVRVGGKMEVRKKQTATGLDGWVPICEKNLPYELTASFLLMASRPGVPLPIKLQEQHKPFFPLDQPITEAAGQKLAVWAKGADTSRLPNTFTSPAPSPEPPLSSASSTPDGTDDRTSLIALLNDEMAKWRKKPTEQETWTLIAAFSGGEGDPAKLDPAMLSDILATFRKCTNQDAAAIRQVKAALGWK